ncbi:hypothetical protein BDW72DRAFT_178156 [Aspergillus terricola var. indicus]
MTTIYSSYCIISPRAPALDSPTHSHYKGSEDSARAKWGEVFHAHQNLNTEVSRRIDSVFRMQSPTISPTMLEVTSKEYITNSFCSRLQSRLEAFVAQFNRCLPVSTRALIFLWSEFPRGQTPPFHCRSTRWGGVFRELLQLGERFIKLTRVRASSVALDERCSDNQTSAWS